MTAIPCPALLGDVNADWAEGTAGVMTGTCRPGYFVATAPFVTQRTCSLTTGWGVVAPSCQRTWTWGRASCTNIHTHYSRTHVCIYNTTVAYMRWTPTEISCPATTANGASFASVAAGTESLVGVCAPGFAGSATANCSILGAWSFEGECTGALIRRRPAASPNPLDQTDVCMSWGGPSNHLPGHRRRHGQLCVGSGGCFGTGRLCAGLWRQPAARVHPDRRVARTDGRCLCS
jgi:hypothetical protein